MKIEVTAQTLPQGWEQAVVACWQDGVAIKTQYDKPGDPPSRDCSLSLTILDPMAEPRIHRAFPGGLEDLETYRQEVVEGIHDHWIAPEEGKWSYTYHQRLWAYPHIRPNDDTSEGVAEFVFDSDMPPHNQIQRVIDQLIEAPHTRRAQAIVWIPFVDQFDEHAPCLQRLWFRIFDDALQMNVHIRSNDAFKAGFMNMWAFTDIQRYVAQRVSTGLARPIRVGEYNHFADSWHIYGSYFDEFEKSFLTSLEKRTFEERVWRSDDEIVQSSFESARQRLAAENRVEFDGDEQG